MNKEFIKENWYAIFSCELYYIPSYYQFISVIFGVLKFLLIHIIRFLAFSASLSSILSSSCLTYLTSLQHLTTLPSFKYVSFTSSSPSFTCLKFPFADAQFCDSPPGCRRVQHCSVAQKPREEPQHGCFAAWPRPGLSGYNRRGEQQLH